jgi:hypothetical protein
MPFLMYIAGLIFMIAAKIVHSDGLYAAGHIWIVGAILLVEIRKVKK